MFDVVELMPPAIYTTIARYGIVGDVVHEDRDVHICDKDDEWWRIYRKSTNRPCPRQTKSYAWWVHRPQLTFDETSGGEPETVFERHIYYDALFVVHMRRMGREESIVDVSPDVLDAYIVEMEMAAHPNTRSWTPLKSCPHLE